MFSVAFVWLVLLSGCCGTNYSYYVFKKKGEAALLSKNYKKAQNYFSVIYQNESKSNYVDREKTTWAYYRLGVIAELMGDLKRAKGYYWGDAIDSSFYAGIRLVNWYAQSGWKYLDGNSEARTLEEILELEKTEPPEIVEEDEEESERKKEVIIPKKNVYRHIYRKTTESSDYPKKVPSQLRVSPSPDEPEVFQVFF